MQIMVHEQIEVLRLQMQIIASDKDLTDPRVIRVSEKLDVLINEFYLSQKRNSNFESPAPFNIHSVF